MQLLKGLVQLRMDLLRLGFRVVLYDEFKTSASCPDCFNRTNSFQLHRSPGPWRIHVLRRQYMDYLEQNQGLANFLANTKGSEIGLHFQKTVSTLRLSNYKLNYFFDVNCFDGGNLIHLTAHENYQRLPGGMPKINHGDFRNWEFQSISPEKMLRQ